MDRLQRLSDRVKKLEENGVSVYHVGNPNDKPILAASIIVLATVILFCFGWWQQWHWGWLVAIGIFGSGGASGAAGMSE